MSAEAAVELTGRRRALRLARMGAVQALYQMEMTGTEPGDLLADFCAGPAKAGEALKGRVRVPQVAQEHFRRVVQGAAEARERLDRELSALLEPDWRIERMDRTLCAVLRAGAFEILLCADVPPNAAINEYVEISHAFFDPGSTGMVNGLLDALAKKKNADR